MDKFSALDTFSETIAPYRYMWNSIEARVCALVINGEYFLLSSRMYLTINAAEGRDSLVEHEGLGVAMWIQNIPIAQLDDLLRQLRNPGNVTLGGRTLRLDYFNNSSYWIMDKYSGIHTGYLKLDYPYVMLQTNSSGNMDWSDLEKQLYRYGYNGLQSVAEENLGFPVGASYTSNIILAAPIYLKIKKVEIQRESLIIFIETHESVNIRDIELSYEIKHDDNSIKALNDRIYFDESEVIQHAIGLKLIKKSIKANGSISEARTWLYDKLNTEPIDANWIHHESPQKESLAWRILSPLLEERNGVELYDGHKLLHRYLLRGALNRLHFKNLF